MKVRTDKALGAKHGPWGRVHGGCVWLLPCGSFYYCYRFLSLSVVDLGTDLQMGSVESLGSSQVLLFASLVTFGLLKLNILVSEMRRLHRLRGLPG